MEFSQPKGIYQQIADQIRDRILASEWRAGERIPSVRELATNIGVNPNTVNKSYQALLDREIIENQRGIGYFVALDARQRILDELKAEFVRDELPRLFKTMSVLGMTLDDLAAHLPKSDGAKSV
jgi:DNA-binding transcriptional regulator YhcF (GntR family)